ncbi:MAG: DUF3769 domain-containing protein [Cyanobacteria bacterium P01_D01_bin.44]
MAYIELPPEPPRVEVVQVRLDADSNRIFHQLDASKDAEVNSELPILPGADSDDGESDAIPEAGALEESLPEEGANPHESGQDLETDRESEALDGADAHFRDESESESDGAGLDSADDQQPARLTPAEVFPAEPAPDPVETLEMGPAPTAPRLDVTADYQDYDPVRQVLTARGNVSLLLNGSVLQAEKVWINLLNRYALAEGGVLLTRGAQVVRGQRAEYNFVQQAGVIFEAKGELFLPALTDDLSDPLSRPITSRSVFDPLNPDRDLEGVRSAGGIEISSSPRPLFPGATGGVRRLRFEADQLQFDADVWRAQAVRFTNDPFSPPELEFRADEVTLTAISPEQDLLTTSRARIVFDQGFSLPLVRSRYYLSRGNVDSDDVTPFPAIFGIDDTDRGGLFVESRVPVSQTPNFSLELVPQYFIGEALSSGETFSPDVFGLGANLSAQLGPNTIIEGDAELTGLALDDITDNLRVNLQGRQALGSHLLFLDYSYRDRLFNGSLGFQDVRSSLGAVLVSPIIPLNDSGLRLNYQASAQLITAETDRSDLLGTSPTDDLITLGRFQGSARLAQGWTLWRGKPLPATQTEGLRYTPTPIVPQASLRASLQGVATYYTSGDLQELLTGDIRIDAQFGHLSKPFFDYTRLNLGYSQRFVGEAESPFRFDRSVDRRILSFGLTQQIYGPLLLGFQTSINLDNNEAVNTEFIAEYSRRTYGILVRYSPTRETGSIGFRLSDFSWLGNSDPFDDPRIREVEDSVVRP